jgi:tetratricopeptide (TPR) repeat protein
VIILFTPFRSQQKRVYGAAAGGRMTLSVPDQRSAKALTPLDPPARPACPEGAPPRAAAEPWFWVFGGLVALVTLLVFLPSVRNGWVNWDDADNFLGNPHFRGLGWVNLRWIFAGSVQDAHWIPLTWLSLSLDYVMWGMNPAGYHLTSVVIHAVNALLCYALVHRLLELALGADTPAPDLRLGAAVAALFFALHPLRVESVTWITERRDVLMGLFALVTVLAWLHACRSGSAARPSRRWYWTAVSCFALALLGKVMIVGLPIVLVALDVYPLRRAGPPGPGRPARLLGLAVTEKAPFLLLSLAAAAVTLVIAGQRAHATPLAVLGMGQRLAVAGYGLAFYLEKTLVPWPLSPLYTLFHPVMPWSATYMTPTLAVGAITALAVAARRRWPAGLAAWISYVALLLPALGLVHSGAQIAADRYTYMASVVPATLVGAAVAWCRRSSRQRAIAPALGRGVTFAVVLWLGVLALLTIPQIRIWKDSVSLWRHAAEAEPASDIPIFYLGWALTEAGRFDEAREHFQRSLARVPADLPSLRAQFLFHLGIVALRAGQPAEAETRFREALRFDPEQPAAWTRLGTVLWEGGRRDEAQQAWARAVALAGRWGRYQMWEIRQAAEEMPAAAVVARGRLAFNLGAMLEQYGQRAQALEQYRLAASLSPDDDVACRRAARLAAEARAGGRVACVGDPSR